MVANVFAVVVVDVDVVGVVVVVAVVVVVGGVVAVVVVVVGVVCLRACFGLFGLLVVWLDVCLFVNLCV